MNQETLKSIQERLNSLELWRDSSNKVISALKIDKQLVVNKDQRLKPGIACKVGYNSDGLITSTDTLTPTDIPTLPIEKINGLRDLLNEKVSLTDITSIRRELSNVYHHSDPVSTGCKVNVDEHGFVTDVSGLTEGDIPTLPISKISGLSEILTQLQSLDNQPTTVLDYTISPGTACKITYDEHGRVTGSEELTLSDLPSDILHRLSTVETGIMQAATQKSLSNISQLVTNKLDSNSPITPGKYTKVEVDHKGLITSGSQLTKEDLPTYTPDDILGLNTILSNKVDRSELGELNTSISSLTNTVNKFGDIYTLRDSVQSKVDRSEIQEIKSDIQELKTLVNRMISIMPSDQLFEQLTRIEGELSSLQGRVTLLED